MPLSFFTKSSAKKNLTLLVDVGSSSVGVALVEVKKGAVPHILASVREDIPFQGTLSSSRFLFAMNRTLDKALASIQPKASTMGVLKDVFCTLSSPWFILRTRNLAISRPQEFEVNEQNLEQFLNEDVAVLSQELKEKLPPQDIRIIEKKIIQIKLNGYDIQNPFKQRTSRMEIRAIVGVSSQKVTQSIEERVHKFFHKGVVHFGVFPIVAFNTIRDIFPTDNSALFLDITGEATDVSRIENDLLVGTVSFAYGKNFFIREISARLRTVHEEAASLFAMFLRGELDETRHAKVAEIISLIEKEWLSRFEKSINTLARNEALPRKIFFTADSDIEPLFAGLIAKANSKFLLDEAFDVQYLDQLLVSKFVTFEPAVTRDSFIIVESLLAQKLTEAIAK